MVNFIREDRYIVLKIKDIERYLNQGERLGLDILCNTIQQGRARDDKPHRKSVVIQDNWYCYDKAWELIEEEEGEYGN